MSNILVSGANGQIGLELISVISSKPIPNYEFIFLDKSNWDISNPQQTKEIIHHYKPSIIINTAAYTNVDKAESEVEECIRINATAVKNLAQECTLNNIKLIHFSSDYVFNDPNASLPLKENHPKNPQGIYALSKSKAEDYILEFNPTAIIIRSSWIYSTWGHNFVKTMLRLSTQHNELKVVNDQLGSPTYAFTIAELCHHIISNDKVMKMQGIFHYANEGSVSWNDFAKEIFLQSKIKISVLPISTKEYNAKAPRPLYSVLDCSKIKNELGILIPTWQESLSLCLQKMNA